MPDACDQVAPFGSPAVAPGLSTMDLQGALQQLQAHVRTQVEIVLTNLPGVATRESFDEALYNRFLNARQVIPLIYGQMLEWSNQLNNLAFAQGLQGLAEALNVITLEVDAALQQGVDEARKNRFIQGVTNADAVMSTFLQNVRNLNRGRNGTKPSPLSRPPTVLLRFHAALNLPESL